MVQDLFQALRPQMHRWDTFEDAAAAVAEIEREEAAALAAGLPGDDDDDDDDSDISSMRDASEYGGVPRPDLVFSWRILQSSLW
jgi:hypothetical protein